MISGSDKVEHSLPYQKGKKNTESLSIKSKYFITAFVVGALAGGVITGLGIVNTFGPVGTPGFISSMAGSGLMALIPGGGLIWIIIVNCKNSKNSLKQSWKQRLTHSNGLYTNAPRYADQCVEQLAIHNVPLGYQKLMVWEPTRSCPDVFTFDGVASTCAPSVETLEPRSILLLVVIDSDWPESRPTHPKQLVLKRKLENVRGPDSPVVLHFVNVVKPLFGLPQIHLSAQQCEEIADHRGEALPMI
jgi:hypothetical protein